MELLLLSYNNYFNRIIKKENSTVNYISAVGTNYDWKLNIDFDPKDGVDTEQVINWDKDFIPDYLVCTSGQNYDIKSRWFIVKWTRIRGKQYSAILHRDVIADNLDTIKESTCFVEKGTVGTNDSAIYNQEDMTFNQIKKEEFLLKDETQCGWVVGYVANTKDSEGTLTPTTFSDTTLTNPEAADGKCKETYASREAFYEAHPEFANDMAVIKSLKYSVQLDVCYGNLLSNWDTGITCSKDYNGNVTWIDSAFNNNLYLHGKNSTVAYGSRWLWKSWIHDARQKAAESLLSGWTNAVMGQFKTALGTKLNVSFVTDDDANFRKLIAYVNSNPTVKIGSDYFKVQLGQFNAITDSIRPTQYGSTAELMNSSLNKYPTGIQGNDVITGNYGPETFNIEYSYQLYRLAFIQIFPTCKAKVPTASEIPVLKDAPYKMFAIPYSDDLTIFSGNNVVCEKTKSSIAVAAAQALTAAAGNGAVYDVQLLPYCPVREAVIKEFQSGFTLSNGGSYDMVWNRIVPPPDLLMLDPTNTTVQPFTTLRYLKENWWYYLRKTYSSMPTMTVSSGSVINIKYYDGSETIMDYQAYSISINTASNIVVYGRNSTVLLTIPYATYQTDNSILAAYFSRRPTISGVATATSTAPYAFYNLTIFDTPGYVSKVDIANVLTSDIVVEVEGGTDVLLNKIFWCTKSQDSFTLELADQYLDTVENGQHVYKLNLLPQTLKSHLAVGFDGQDVKIKNQTDMLRIASPNYSNFFDLNIQRNKGVNAFNIDFTYKPYQPYIHVNPDFDGLYGKDFKDIRGLICGGDFSIALTTDAWATYQLNNKTYMQVFDREMQALQVNNRIQKQNDIAGAIGGTFTGAASGAITGAMASGGNPYAAAAGAIVGGISSLVGGVADVQNNEILRNQEMSLKKDRFGYELQNIKALPQGLAKTSALTNNNKVFPFLEFYTCTEEEIHALENKIQYNGMTIMRVGTVKDFVTQRGNFFKGSLIRINTTEDYTYVAVINDELQKGVYL